jgi:Zn finger protein HypA/HybF involved in hydrogenase expression
MIHYYLECDNCDQESQVSFSSKSRAEPEFCPSCGLEINAQVIDGDEDDLD